MLYKVVRGLLKFVFIFLGLKSEGLHNLPEKGPVILAANHVSNWDPVLVALAVKRPISFMAKAELFSNPVLAAIMRAVYAFPVKRGTADRKAIREALDVLQEGRVLGIFPEGARRKVQQDATVQAGVAMIALKSGAPVVPVACVGTDRTFPLGWIRPLVIRIGPPIKLDSCAGKMNSAGLEDLSLRIMKEIQLLLCK